MREHPREIVYTETKPGRMETDQERRDREEQVYYYWDKAGPWIFPAAFSVMIVLVAIGEVVN